MDTDTHRCRMFFDYDQRDLCPAAQAAGVGAVLMAPLPDGLFDGAWSSAAREKLREAREGCDKMGGAELCALLPAGGFLIEPYGELPFAAAVAHYAAAAKEAKDQGADSVLLHRARSLLQARAGVLGAREAGLPVYVTVELTGEGEGLAGDGDILAAFVTLQELGVAAFGFCAAVTGIILDAVGTVAPFSRVPLIALTRDLTGELPGPETGALFTARTARLAQLGAVWQGILGAEGRELACAIETLSGVRAPEAPRVDYRGEEEIWAAGEKQVFYLDGGIEFSSPIRCESDMADEIIRLEHQGEQAICIQPETADDGYNISLNNANLTMLPAAFLCDDEDALDSALFYYNGRAMVDSRSIILPERLREIAARYGAVVV